MACAAAVLLAGALHPPGAQSDWFRVESMNFIMYTDTGAEDGERLLADLESRYALYRRDVFPVLPRHEKIAVVVFRETDDFRRLIPGWVGERTDEDAYLVSGEVGTFILARDRSADDIAADIAHPLGHLLLSRSIVWRPFWLEEGVGEYLRRAGTGERPPEVGDPYRLSDLLAAVPSAAYDDLDEGGDFRRQSYLLFRILLEDSPALLGEFLARLVDESGVGTAPRLDEAAVESRLNAYAGDAPPLDATGDGVQAGSVTYEEAASVLGDAALAAGLESVAREFYSASRNDRARIGLARIRGRQSEGPAVRGGLEALMAELPESGMPRYLFGILEPGDDLQRREQTEALTEATERMPSMGRAWAGLGWLSSMDAGQEAEGIRLIREGVRLEPEFADRFFEQIAEIHLRRGDLDGAAAAIETAAFLPHSDPETLERYERLVPDFYRRIESRRRELEGRRVEELRRELEALVDAVDPAPGLVAEEPAPVGRVSYSVRSGASGDVEEPVAVSAPTPEYPPDLRLSGVQGRVVLDVALDRSGKVTSVDAVSSDDARLTALSREAVAQWDFRPARRNLESVPFRFRLTLTFYLE